MTSATKELRRLLDELGVEYLDSEDDTTIYYAGSGYRYTYNTNPESGWAQLFGYHLTPEKAIAATLGSGELTAESVRQAIERHSLELPRCGRQFLDQAWQAIADELNATLGERTCKNLLPHDWGTFECSECGKQFEVTHVYITPGGTPNDEPDPTCVSFCPGCGRKVVDDNA